MRSRSLPAHRVVSPHVVVESVEKTKSDVNLRKKVLSHYKEMGLEDDFSHDLEEEKYCESKDHEELSEHMEFIDEYDERKFWE
jgi:hypothetical protein